MRQQKKNRASTADIERTEPIPSSKKQMARKSLCIRSHLKIRNNHQLQAEMLINVPEHWLLMVKKALIIETDCSSAPNFLLRFSAKKVLSLASALNFRKIM